MKAYKFTRKIGMKLVALACTLMMTMQIGAVSIFAAPKIQKTKYDGKGVVEVDFRNKVQYKNLKVTVKDSNGKAYNVRITERDDDELEFAIRNYKEGLKYSYTISGVRARGERAYGKVSGVVTIPKTTATVKVKKVSVDIRDKEVDFDFNKKVTWKKPAIKITDGKTTYSARITDRDDDEMEVYVRGLKRGKTYQYTITGIYARGTSKALTLKGTFRA